MLVDGFQLSTILSPTASLRRFQGFLKAQGMSSEFLLSMHKVDLFPFQLMSPLQQELSMTFLVNLAGLLQLMLTPHSLESHGNHHQTMEAPKSLDMMLKDVTCWEADGSEFPPDLFLLLTSWTQMLLKDISTNTRSELTMQLALDLILTHLCQSLPSQ